VKPVSDGRAVLKYLAPYVFRVTISDNRILECTDESVTFKYTPSGTKTVKTRKASGVKFVRGFLQHACVKGVRHQFSEWPFGCCAQLVPAPLTRLDGVELADHTRSREMACLAVSGLDVLARQRRGSSAGST